MSKIVADVKEMIGIHEDTVSFNIEIRTGINSAFFALHQMGVGPSTPFQVDNDTTWDEFITTAPKDAVLEFVYLRTKLIFDPPASSYVVEVMKDRLSELSFRLNAQVDNGNGIVIG